MNIRLLLLLTFTGLLSACSSAPTAPPAQPEAVLAEPTPAGQNEISGNLLGVPEGAVAEVALLTIGSNGLPFTTLGNIQLRGTGEPLPFRVLFNPQAFAKGIRVELRGRANQSGKLILHMPKRVIDSPQSQSVGDLRMVPAP
ncbi:MAG: hypothetical protein CMK71_03835 [Pseudomonadaceae bacterium]|nr:hypothetical protein [Pseudomonadaceae bacterium]